MKIKILLAFITLTMSSVIFAAETISIVWGFNIASNQASTLRLISDEANKAQSKYNFIVESKPGAGGSIAANHILRNPNTSIVGMSSSFFIRPSVETVGIHDLDKFKTILVQGTGAPIVVVSKKYKNINELLKQENPSIGISGIGSISDMVANALKEKNPNLNIVNFKGMVDAAYAAGGGHVDAAIAVIDDAKSMIDAKEVAVIGYTGSVDMKEYPGLKLVTFGIQGADKLVANYGIFASTDMPNEKYIEIYNILAKSSKSEIVLASYKKDLLIPSDVSLEKSTEWYNSERQHWKNTVSRLFKK
jgi:tripartite-type tricarboxylate transporter receptor subunit TctC